MRRSSPSTAMSTPRARSPSVVPAIRSDALWRSSPAPRMVVVPSAQAAARHRIGISSIAAATSSGPRSIDLSAEERTRRSARGSPMPGSVPAVDDGPASPAGVSSISAPMARRRSMTARRVGLTPTSRIRRSASGWIAAATSQKAAAETSPGTRSSIAAIVRPPSRVTATAPGRSSASAGASRSVVTPIPRARSIRSV